MSFSMPVIAVRNLMRRPLSTLFTAIGVAIGITAIIAISGISKGLERTWQRAFEVRGADVVVVGKGGGLMSNWLDMSVKDRILRLDGVADATAILWAMQSIEDAPQVVISGREWGGFGWQNLKIIQGRMPRDENEKAAVLGTTAAEVLHKKVGDTLQIELEEFTITGIVDGGAPLENRSVTLALPLAQKALGQQGKVNFVNIRLKRAGVELAASSLCREIESVCPNTRATLARDTLNSNRGFRMLRAGSLAITLLATVVGVFGVMNTMLMSVFERTQEIGVLSALGWKRRRIMVLVLLESMALSLMGFAIGLGAGLVLIQVLGRSSLLHGLLEPYVGPELVFIALMIAMFVGVASGLYPAWRGARVSPGVALRSS
ncbi:MAG: ABC transporter permease [Verrucomicrobiota bacterium]